MIGLQVIKRQGTIQPTHRMIYVVRKRRLQHVCSDICEKINLKDISLGPKNISAHHNSTIVNSINVT